jgi:hypothetical protein
LQIETEPARGGGPATAAVARHDVFRKRRAAGFLPAVEGGTGHAEGADRFVALIVGENEDDVGFFCGGKSGDKGEGGEEVFHAFWF